MKRISLLLSSALFMLASCQEAFNELDPTVGEAPVFEAEAESFDVDTKTSLTENNTVVWTQGDEINIFRGNTMSYRYRLADASAGEPNASFSVVTEGGDSFSAGTELPANIAVYPYNSAISASAVTGGFKLNNVVLPATQTYNEDSFGSGSFVMVAVTRNLEDRILSFRNVLGVMKLQLKGLCSVKSITVTGNDGEKLSGAAEIVAGVDMYEPSIVMKDAAGTSVTLNCGQGVALNSTNTTDFYIALPPVTFSEGFTVEVKDTDNVVYTIEAKAVNVIQRSYILNMPAITLADGEVAETASTDPIVFADENVKARCVEIYDTNGDGELSYMEAAAVTSLNGLFNSYYTRKHLSYNFVTGQSYEGEQYIHERQFFSERLTTFDELQYFTGLTEIDPFAFYETGLGSVVLPPRIKQIGINSFYGCAMTSLDFPEGIKVIRSLPDCLTELIVPEGVTELNGYMYLGIVRQYDQGFIVDNTAENFLISLPKSLMNCSLNISRYNYSHNFKDQVTLAGSALNQDGRSFVNENGYLFLYDATDLTEYKIPEGVKRLSGRSFSLNSQSSNITSITIPESFPEPQDNILRAFGAVSEVKGKYATQDGKSLISGNKLIGVVYSLEDYTIPENITEIAEGAFYGSALTEIEIPASVTKIGSNAFSNSSNLKKVTLPSTITEIPANCFSSCVNLEEINLNDVEVLGYYAFYGCNKLLTRMKVPANIVEIGYRALYQSSGSSILEFQSSIPPVLKSGWVIEGDSYVLASDTFSPATFVYVPDNAINKYGSTVYSEIWPDQNVRVLNELYTDPEVRVSNQYENCYLVVNEYNYKLNLVRTDSDGSSFKRVNPSTSEESTVTITKPFYIGEVEFPQKLWEDVMHSYPGEYYHRDDSHGYPVEGITADECLAFIAKLNALIDPAFKQAYPDFEFRLPTEAEWEFAAKGGINSENFKFAGSNDPSEVWASRSYNGGPNYLKSKKANELGLYDMNGNVWEYCSDYFYRWNSQNPVPSGTDPYVNRNTAMNFSSGNDLGLVLRGGDAWSEYYQNQGGFIGINTNRNFYLAGIGRYVGFRLAVSLPANWPY